MKQKVLIYDVETTPSIGYFWRGKYQQDIIKEIKHYQILCFSYKWLNQKKVSFKIRGSDQDDKNLCIELHKILSKADVVVAHNGDSFDNKVVKTRMIFHKLIPLKIMATVDTKRVAKHMFGFNSNSLNDIGEYLGLGSKHAHSGFQLWLDCMNNKKKAWVEMVKYNKQDVVLLEISLSTIAIMDE